jgi:short-subunit dehydrogenase
MVIGASSGIGRASALRFADRGARLILVSRSEKALEVAAEACRARGARSVAVRAADINDRQAVDHVIFDTVSSEGRIDVVVHTAAVMAYGTIEDLPSATFDHVVHTAICGTANVARAVLAVFRTQEKGSLVIVSSLLASITAPTMGAYATSKWGQLGLVRTLQLETRDLPDVHISAVAPGGVNTPIYYQAATVTGHHGNAPPPAYSADRVAAKIDTVVDRPRRLVNAGILNPVIVAGFRLLPPVFDLLVGPLLAIFGTAQADVDSTDGNVFQPVPEHEATDGTPSHG